MGESTRRLNTLIVADNEADAEQVVRALIRSGYAVSSTRSRRATSSEPRSVRRCRRLARRMIPKVRSSSAVARSPRAGVKVLR
jgi:hypothetical protein